MQRAYHPSICLAALALCLLIAPSAWAQGGREDLVVRSATTVLNEIMVIPARGIPQALLAKAEGVVIIPNMIKGGFVVGVRHGRGVVLVRDENRAWQPPQFVSMTGGSFGWQAGVQATDVVLVFQTRKSIEGLLGGKFTIGVDAAATAGPVGRQASAGTDLTLKSEIYSYSRSRGLFVGASVDGSSLQIDRAANQNYYAGTGLTIAGQPATNTPVLPTSAAELLATVSQYSDFQVVPGHGPGLAAPGQPAQGTPQEGQTVSLRQELAAAANQLAGVLDGSWRRYLALPPEIFQQGPPPSVDALQASLARYNRIASEPQYAALVQRGDFQQVHALLISYTNAVAALAADGGAVQLPPPPTAD